jgi:hypothetical protein
VREQQVAVQVDVVHQRRDLRTRRDRETRLDHAAEHHAEPERPSGVRHSHRFTDPARLCELDVDPVRALRASRHVGERVAVLVDEDRHGRATLQLLPVRVAGGQRLLAVLDVHLREVLERLVERPVLVHVDLERTVGHGPHRTHTLDVQAVSSAELQLQPSEAGRRPLRATRHVVGVAEPDRPGRRRASAAQAEQPPDRLAREFPAEVVERGVERRARSELPPRQAVEDLVERERIVPEELGVLLDVRASRLGRLVVALDGRRLAEAAHALVPDFDLAELDLVLRVACDHEGFGEGHRDKACAELHAARQP